MLTINEQKILLEMLIASLIKSEQKIFKSNHFYRVMSKLKKKGYIKVVTRFQNDKRIKAYELTQSGLTIASWIAKDFDTPKKYLTYARKIQYVIT